MKDPQQPLEVEIYQILQEYIPSLSHRMGPMMCETHPYVREREHIPKVPNNNPLETVPNIIQTQAIFGLVEDKENEKYRRKMLFVIV